jgi:GNAT superfamily N-acetyltransferase
VDWLARSVRYYRRRYDDGDLRSFVAEADGRIVGCATAFLLDGYPREFIKRPNAGYIVGVYVEPAYRRRGVASDLTRAAVEWLRTIGCSVVRLRASDEGRNVYEKLGFRASSEMEMRI